jgi:hypothetical protein
VRCGGLKDISYGNKLRVLRPGHRSFWGFTRIIREKFRRIPALILDRLTLITESRKTDAIASKFSLAHDNTLRSELSTSVRNGCSIINNNAFNDNSSSYLSPREIRNLNKKLKSGKAPGWDGVPNGEQRFS